MKITLMGAIAVGVVISGISTSGASSGQNGHEEVLRQRQLQDILPFDEVLKIVRPRIKGAIIETEFEIEDGIPVYEIKYIDDLGRVLELYVDAKTGTILKEEID